MISNRALMMMQSVRIQCSVCPLQSCLSRYYHNESRIRYPGREIHPRKHKYDYETHKKYARAMSELKSKRRRDVSTFVENKKMISDLLAQGQTPSHIFFVEERLLSWFDLPDTTEKIHITERQMNRLTDVAAPQGILAIFDRPLSYPADRKCIPLIIYLDKLKDLGNAGTIIRSAAGANCMSVIFSPESVHAWKPAVLRASAGSNYLIPVYEGMEFEEVLHSLPQDWNVCVVQSKNLDSAPPTQTIPYHNIDFTIPTLMVFGNETFGISPQIIDKVSETHNLIKTHIPINESMDSLNVAMAASILIFEMAKQQAVMSREDMTDVAVENIQFTNHKQIDRISKTDPTIEVEDNNHAIDNDIVDKLDSILLQQTIASKDG